MHRCVRVPVIGLVGYEASLVRSYFPGKASCTWDFSFIFDLRVERLSRGMLKTFREAIPLGMAYTTAIVMCGDVRRYA